MSDYALYLYQVLPKYPKGFRVTDLDSRVDARVVANVDRQTNGQKTGSLYHAMPEAGATKMREAFTHFFQQKVETNLKILTFEF